MAKKPTLAASTLSRDSGVPTRGSDSAARRRNDIKRSVHHLRARGCGYACSFTNVGVHWSFTSPPSPSRVVRLGLPQPLGGPRHTLALHVELHQPGQGQTSDPEQTDARGGSHLGRDVIRDDLRARGEGHGESTSESVISGRGVYDALRDRTRISSRGSKTRGNGTRTKFRAMCECTGKATPSARSIGATPPGMAMAVGTRPARSEGDGGVRSGNFLHTPRFRSSRRGLERAHAPANANPEAW